MNKMREKQAKLLFSCGRKYLIEMGFDKQAEDPRVVFNLLKAMRSKEGLEYFAKEASLKLGIEKQSQDFSKWWKPFWTNVKGWFNDPNVQKALARGGIGMLGGGLLGGLTGGSRGAIAGGLLGGAGTGLGSYYWDDISKMLGWNVPKKRKRKRPGTGAGGIGEEYYNI